MKLVLRQNLKNVSCSSLAHRPGAFRRKDVPAFQDVKIRSEISAISKEVFQD